MSAHTLYVTGLQHSALDLPHLDLSQFSEKKKGWWGRLILPEILGQTDTVGAKSPIFSRYSLVAPQP